MATTGGVSGVVRMGVDRNTLKRPHLLGIHRGRMVSIDEEGFVPFLKIRSSEYDRPRTTLPNEVFPSQSLQP
jgi:hypothetical protein